jgi:hypothetical protein
MIILVTKNSFQLIYKSFGGFYESQIQIDISDLRYDFDGNCGPFGFYPQPLGKFANSNNVSICGGVGKCNRDGN